MCKFCKTLKEIYKVPIRSTYSDDNCCEFVSPDNYDDNCCDCDGCNEDNYLFRLKKYENRLGFDFYHKIKKLTIDVSSELLSFNYCPWCGEKIVDNVIPFEQCCLETELELDE